MVNYLSARVTCTDCVDDGENQDCEICANLDGDVERMKDWYDFMMIIIIYNILLNKRSESDGINPIEGFVEWILNAWDAEYNTYIWVNL